MAVALALFALASFAIGAFAGGKVHSSEDYVVAGRRLNLFQATSTVLATWFGAGTLLVASDEVANEGLRAAALDPIGAGICLLIAGIVLARPLWEMKLVTLPDFYRIKFGPQAELWASILMVPGYIGWIAAQYTALAALTVMATGMDFNLALVLVAAIGTGYTLLGGMWAVTLTDAMQMPFIAIGVLVLAWAVFTTVGDGSVALGWMETWRNADDAHRVVIPEGARAAWTTAFLAGALGNLPGQDLTQRMFAARSANIARAACLISGGLYLVLGAVPVMMALAAPLLLDEVPESGVLTAMAIATEIPGVTVIFAVGVAAAVLSTIDSAILAPATVIAHNLVGRVRPVTVGLHRLSVFAIGGAALLLAFLGEDAYSLLESSYEIGMVSMLVPLVMGLWWPRGARACLASMAVGTTLWALHLVLGVEGFLGTFFPMGLGATLCGLAAYCLVPTSNGRTA